MKRIHLIEMLAVMLGLMSSCTDNNDNPSGGENRWGDKTLTFNVDNVSFNMIQVEGGSYQMNTLNDDSGAKLNISGTLSDYYIGQTEVTNQLWASVMGYRPELQFHDADEYPVTQISYYDIMKADGFLAKLNALLKDQLPAGKKFRLPSEAQWTYALQGGKAKSNPPANVGDVAWISTNAGGEVHPVAQKEPNSLGLYDMIGNAVEYIRDNYLDNDDLPTNQGRDFVALNNTLIRVICGGAYFNNETNVFLRDWIMMFDRYISIGFRLVLADAVEEETVTVPPTADELFYFYLPGFIEQAFNMIKVEGGDYSMVYERDGQQKAITGTLSDYYISQTEVENGVWYAIMGELPTGQITNKYRYPVTMVSYEDITKPGGFIDKLNELVKDDLPEGMAFQLPTEAQWHYAALGGQKSNGYVYAGSDNLDKVAWNAANTNKANGVAMRWPNELGIYDMTGNLNEICRDRYAPLADLPAEQGTDYAGPATGETFVCSGGAFDSDALQLPVNYRAIEVVAPNHKCNSLGFRLVLTKNK